MVTRTEPLSIIRQCELLDLPRSTFYHVPKPVSEAARRAGRRHLRHGAGVHA